MKKLFSILLVLLMCGTSYGHFIKMSGNKLQTDGHDFVVKGIWTDPVGHSWQEWWGLSVINFEADIDARFILYDSLDGLNVIRTCVDGTSIQGSDFLEKFNYLKNRCKTANYRLVIDVLGQAVVPGNGHGGQLDTTSAKALINTLIDTYKADTTIGWWDFRGEGLNGLWAVGYPLARVDSMMQWMKTMHNYIKSVDTNHLVVTHAEAYHMIRAGQVSNTYDLSDIMDFCDIELYSEPMFWSGTHYGDMGTYGSQSYSETGYFALLKFFRSSEGRDMLNKPIEVAETGYSTGNHSQLQQLEYLSITGDLVKSEEICGFCVWADRNAHEIGSSIHVIDSQLGLYDSSGVAKLSRDWFSGYTLGSERYEIFK